MQASLKVIFLLFLLFILNHSNTVAGTVEGTSGGVYKNIKTTHHYLTCIFTKAQCGDLDLD